MDHHPHDAPDPASDAGEPTLQASDSAPTSPPLPPARMPDPGGRRSGILALIAAFIFGGAVIGIQNLSALSSNEAAQPTTVEQELIEAAAEDQPVPGNPQIDLMLRLFVRMSEFTRQDPKAIVELDKHARTPVDRLRVAVAAGEFVGPEAAAERLAGLAETLPEDAPLRRDAELLQRVYEEGSSESLEPGQRDRLVARHGFAARVALTHPLPASDPARRELRSGGLGATVALGLFALLLAGVLLSGTVLFFVAVVLVATGRIRPRMPRPAPGGSVYLESFALFTGGFLFVQILAGLLDALTRTPDGESAPWAPAVGLGLQWSLLLIPFWPLVRHRFSPRLEGMHAQRFAGTVGLHRGRGFWREVGAGVLGYLAGVPVFVAGIALTLVLVTVWTSLTGGDSQTPANPLFDLIAGADPLMIALIVLLATVWAPLCEELIFRGGLYRHLRSRLPIPIAAVVSAAVFAFMHGYGPLFAFPVMALGFNFALIREWRGSLIGCITAHALHNGTIMLLLITMVTTLDLTSP